MGTLLIVVLSLVLATPPAPEPTERQRTLFDSLDAKAKQIVTRRAKDYRRMPDGLLWDGTYYRRWRELRDKHLHEKFPASGPGAWVVDQTEETRAWGMFGEWSEFLGRRLLCGAPPLWMSSKGRANEVPFAFVDEANVDRYTKDKRGHYLEIIAWKGGTYNFRGATETGEQIAGDLRAPPKRFVSGNHLVGTFFLVPDTAWIFSYEKRSWTLVDENETRVTPYELAEAIMDDEAEIVEWTYKKFGDAGAPVWNQRTIEIQFDPSKAKGVTKLATPGAAKPATKEKENEKVGPTGPDMIVLKDGKWYYGKVVRRDAKEVVLKTTIGTIETELTFALSDVAQVLVRDETLPKKDDK